MLKLRTIKTRFITSAAFKMFVKISFDQDIEARNHLLKAEPHEKISIIIKIAFFFCLNMNQKRIGSYVECGALFTLILQENEWTNSCV